MLSTFVSEISNTSILSFTSSTIDENLFLSELSFKWPTLMFYGLSNFYFLISEKGNFSRISESLKVSEQGFLKEFSISGSSSFLHMLP